MPNTFRITTYEITSGFTGTGYNLYLENDLQENYFLMINGGAFGGSTRFPDEIFVQATADPFGTGDLSTSSGPREITLEKGGSGPNDWRGTVTVVECMGDEDASGFKLIDVVTITIPASGTTATSRTITPPVGSNVSQMVPFGGFRGGGVKTTNGSSDGPSLCHGRFELNGDPLTDVTWTRDLTGSSQTSSADATVYVVEWGSEWSVDHVQVTGSAGGNGAANTSHYNTGSISTVNRDNTFVWGCGHTSDGGIGDSFSGTLVTLGDGVNQNTTENTVAVGQEYSDNRTVEVYVMTHADLAVDYVFKPDGDSILTSFDHTVDSALGSETYTSSTGVDFTSGYRMAIQYNTSNGTGNAFPRPYWGARHTASTTMSAFRQYNGQNWVAWIQSVDFANISYTDSARRRITIA